MTARWFPGGRSGDNPQNQGLAGFLFSVASSHFPSFPLAFPAVFPGFPLLSPVSSCFRALPCRRAGGAEPDGAKFGNFHFNSIENPFNPILLGCCLPPSQAPEFVVPYNIDVPLLPAAGLWLAFSVKHFLADFVLQTGALARGKEQAQGWLVPLAVHAGSHGALTLLIALVVAPRLWPLGLADFVIHFCVDRGKSLVGRWGGWAIQDAPFWWLFGFDQFLHQVTNVGLAVVLLAG